MSSPGLDLLLRVVRDQLGAKRCRRCAAPLQNPALTLREQSAERVVIEVVCRACAESLLLHVEPESDGGVARVG